jgi:anti-anti-sigma regulatory factor
LIPGAPVRDHDASAGSPQDEALGLHLHRLDRRRMVLYVTGELDRLTAPVLVALLDERLAGERPDTVLTVDLTATAFVDVGGLNALLDVQHRAAVRGITLHVGACRAAFLRLLRVTRTLGLAAAPPDRPWSTRPHACRDSEVVIARLDASRVVERGFEQGETLLEVERGVYRLEAQPPRHHGERDRRADPHHHGPGAAEPGGRAEAAQGVGGEGVDDVERGDVDDHAPGPPPADLVHQVLLEPHELAVVQGGVDGRDEGAALGENGDP